MTVQVFSFKNLLNKYQPIGVIIPPPKGGYPLKPYEFEFNPGARLAYYRTISAQYHPSANWRLHRHSKPKTIKAAGIKAVLSPDRKKWFVDNLDTAPFINLGDASQHCRLDHSGWYADQYYDNLIKPAVVAVRNPRKLYGETDDGTKTHLVFFAATYHSNFDMATIYTYSHETARDAAMYADRCAELEAEQWREETAKNEAELDIEQAREAIHAINRQVLQLIKEAKAQTDTFGPALCQAIRNTVAAYLADRKKQFCIIQARIDNYWSAVENY